MLGNITGKSVLDLACGEEYYTRKLKHSGATRVVGFKQIRWQKLIVSSEAVEDFDQEFWQDIQDYPSTVAIECLK